MWKLDLGMSISDSKVHACVRNSKQIDQSLSLLVCNDVFTVMGDIGITPCLASFMHHLLHEMITFAERLKAIRRLRQKVIYDSGLEK